MESFKLFLAVTPNLTNFHKCPNWDLFTTYEKVFKGVVVINNNKFCRITGIGSVGNKMFNEIVRTLDDVRHVPD